MNDVSVDLQVPDLTGTNYITVLKQLHDALQPKTYLEIGVMQGQSLRLARCTSIAIDPAFQIIPDYLTEVFTKPRLHFFQMGSDDFFARHSPTEIFGAPIDMAFLDGMHRCEYLFRDFINTERHCKRNSIIALHDCLPVEAGITSRVQSRSYAAAAHRQGWWAGDVWRTSLLLRRHRPDLQMTVLDAEPTGLVLITNLDAQNNTLSNNYSALVHEMLSWDLANMGISNLFQEMRMESAFDIQAHDDITKRFWL